MKKTIGLNTIEEEETSEREVSEREGMKEPSNGQKVSVTEINEEIETWSMV